MSLTTPILNTFRPFNSNQQKEFPFFYNGSVQVVRNNLVIERISDSTVVYNQNQETFSLRHILPINTLTNGTEYRARLRVGDVNNNWSQFSDWIVFWVLDNPTLTITTIDYGNQNRVYNQTVLFETTYSHPNSELLESYRYLLYDNNQNLVQSFTEQFSDGSTPLTQEITGLENGVLRYLEVITISSNGQLSSSGLINFIPFYIAPRLLTTLTVENLSSQGAIKISANILQLIGELYAPNGDQINPNDIEYVENDWIDLTRIDYHRLVFNEGFNISQSNFLMKIWCKNIIENEVFLRLLSPEGKLELIKYNDRIHCFKYYNNHPIVPHYASEEFSVGVDDEFTIVLIQDNNLIDVIVE